MCREANPPNRTKVANKYATVARFVGVEVLNSDILVNVVKTLELYICRPYVLKTVVNIDLNLYYEAFVGDSYIH